MGEAEAAGEIVTGALLGRAMEPRAGEGDAHSGGICPNCSTALIGPHCHQCGQSAHIHRSLSGMAHEILHGVFHFEGKLWRTLPLLAWRPGDLTRRYIEGERARFVSPMAIFLFSVFAMFAAFSWAGIGPPSDINTGSPQTMIEEARKELKANRAEAVEARDRRPAGDPRRARQEERIRGIDKMLADLPTPEETGNAGTSNKGLTVSTGKTGWASFDKGLEKWRKNPSLMLYKLQSNSYKFSWLLIPLSLPFVWLLFFWKRRYKLYDHTVFITYSIAFMSLFFIVIAVIGSSGLGGEWLLFAVFGVPFVHIARQLKQAYQLRWWSAILRAFVLSFFISLILGLFATILVTLGMFG
jgi:hypothetical protein